MEGLVVPFSPVGIAPHRRDSGPAASKTAPQLRTDEGFSGVDNGEGNWTVETDGHQGWGKRTRGDGKAESRRRRRSRGRGTFRVRKMVDVLALAVLFVVAVAAVHRMMRCVYGVLSRKASRETPAGDVTRRLSPGPADGNEVSAYLPSYQEAVETPPMELWGAPPPYLGENEEPPPPPSYDVCTRAVFTVDGDPAEAAAPGIESGRSRRGDALFYVLVVLSWLTAIGIAASLSGITTLGFGGTVGIAFGMALLLTLVFLVAFGKLPVWRWLRSRSDGPGTGTGQDNVGFQT